MTVLTGRPLSWAITATAGCGFLLFGYDQGVMSGLLSGAAFIKQFPEIDTTPSGTGSSSLQGTVVAIYEIGCFFGAIFCFMFGERLGRRNCIMLGCIVLSIGAALQASAYTIPHMIVGRIVAGLGNGMNTSTIPVWHSELMQAKKRGKGLAIELAINIFGVMTAYWVDYGFSYVSSGAQFRVPLALQIVFAVVTFAGILFLPESPRWLIAHERHSEARHILWALEMDPNSITESDPAINRQILEIQNAVNEERAATEGRSKTALLKNGPQKFRHRVLLGIGGQFMQQLSGINLITYYAPVIFENSVKLSHNLALLLAGFNGVAYFFSSLIPIWIIDRLGRRKLMLFAAAGQCACMAILAGTVSSGTKAGGVVAIVMLFLFNFFFAVGLLAIPWLLPAEYAPLAIRTRAASLATASNWIFTFLVVEITPVSINSIGWKTYIYFAVFNFFFIPLIWFFYPETQNLSLEQIDKLFTGEKVIIHWHPSMGSIAGTEHSPEAGSTDGDKISEQEIPDIMPEISKAKQNNAPSKDQDQDTPQSSEYMASTDRAHSSTSQHSFHRSPYNNISFAICEDGYMPMDTMSDSELTPNHEHATIHGSTPQSQPMYSDIQHSNLSEADPIFHTGEVAAELLALRYTRHPDSQQDQEPLPINIRQPENDNMHPQARQRIFNEPIFDNQLFGSPKEWRRHLDGCANLIEAIRIHGFVGEVEQALFWCFARMDVCGGLISQEETLIPLNRWTSGRDAWEDHNLFRNPSNTFDVWANYSVFICASVLHLLNSNRTSHCDISRPQNQQDGYALRWQKLYDILQSWYTDRPEEMKPLLAIPVVAEDFQNPFPTVLYGNGSAISGNQLYHTSTLMMLQVKPKGINLGKQSRSILWHARQICAISESNTHHGSWTNSVQPLWIAGKVMSHPSEHSAILRILERIEKETGWDTKWRVDDLKEYWGDLDD
ncbi:hypothetical protein VE04_02125 [Pseudogymnoascus sp. 24MN13]|nr:hypothetical protein VE04_02125 [Pseudogymnoascus sp. 24MN13]